jgi:hypothetical protein
MYMKNICRSIVFCYVWEYAISYLGVVYQSVLKCMNALLTTQVKGWEIVNKYYTIHDNVVCGWINSYNLGLYFIEMGVIMIVQLGLIIFIWDNTPYLGSPRCPDINIWFVFVCLYSPLSFAHIEMKWTLSGKFTCSGRHISGNAHIDGFDD